MYYKIEKPISLLKKALVDKYDFVNEELKPAANSNFECCNCNTKNKISITPYQTGFYFGKVYQTGMLSIQNILKAKLVNESSNRAAHLGAYLVNDLPTLYFLKNCTSCEQPFLLVFGLGESQPGKWVCSISGVWQIKYL